MKLKVLVKFQDIKKPKTVYEPGEVIELSDKDRGERLIDRGLCEAYEEKDEGGNDPKTVLFNEVEYELKTVKEALKAIDQGVANNAGVDAVTKKLTELTEEQSKAVAEILSK